MFHATRQLTQLNIESALQRKKKLALIIKLQLAYNLYWLKECKIVLNQVLHIKL